MVEYQTSLFLFHRDLRVDDNMGLREACERSEQVIPLFILDSILLENTHRSDSAVQFMIESLQDLQDQLTARGAKLFITKGTPTNFLRSLLNSNKINAVFSNEDYTPYARRRDAEIARECKKRDVIFNQFQDSLLVNPQDIFTKSKGKPYTVFTPFFKSAREIPVPEPKQLVENNFEKLSPSGDDANFASIKFPMNENLWVKGGRRSCLEILAQLENFKNYEVEKDVPSIRGTTDLSAHNHWGTCSIREVYHAMVKTLGEAHPLVRQLYWRDFFTYVGFHYPRVFSTSFREMYADLQWLNSRSAFQAWCEGKTGFPIVDAGMRQLNETGFIHNRVRMVVASFLTKDLHIDWRWGERYFAEKLVDFDKAVNNGNWQWSASTGTDAQPYFRVFNPWSQQKKFDPDCEYIKRWIPELRGLTPPEIHRLAKKHPSRLKGYPEPMVDHQEERRLAKSMYADAGND